jgi:hypothetical protein
MLVFTGLAIATGDAHVGMHGRAFAVDVESTRWPAWLGLGLAAIAALAGAVLFLHERGDVEGAPAAYRPPGGSAA